MSTKKKPEGFTFKADGESYVLPYLTDEAAQSVPAGITMDAVMNPLDSYAEWRHNFAILEASNPPEKVLAALRSLPTGEMSRVVLQWLGESRGSSGSSEHTEEPSSTTSGAGSTSD